MVKFLSINFTDISLDKAVDNIFSNIYCGSFIVTPNVDHLVRYHDDPEFKFVYDRAGVFFNDSRILRLLSNFKKESLSNIISGSDLTKSLIEDKRIIDRSVFIIGGSKATASKVSQICNCTLLHHINPSMGFITKTAEVNEIISTVLEVQPDLCFIAVGSPQQEMLADKLVSASFNGTVLCVGASFLFISGEEVRAPNFLRSLNLEWFYRFIKNPKRLFYRYFIRGPKILLLMINDSFK